MTHLGVDHGGALESVDDLRKVGEEPGADGEGLFEVSIIGEIDGGVGELGEAIVVEREQRLEGARNVSECGRLDSVSLLGGFALLGGQCLVKGQTALLVFFAAVAAYNGSSRNHAGPGYPFTRFTRLKAGATQVDCRREGWRKRGADTGRRSGSASAGCA